MIDLGIMVLFLLLCRPVQIPYFRDGSLLNTIYATLSKAAFVGVAVRFFMNLNLGKRGIFLSVVLFQFVFVLSTLLGDGSLYHVIMHMYPILGMLMLLTLAFETPKKAKRFVAAVARLFLVLLLINLAFMILAPDRFHVTYENGGEATNYFLGLENQVGYALLLGFVFAALDRHYTGKDGLFFAYCGVYFLTTFWIFSAATVLGAGVIIAYMVLPVFRRFLDRRRMAEILLAYGIVVVLLVLCSTVILNWGPIRLLITEVLGKNVTLTHRTEVWAVAVKDICQKLFLGYGVHESGNYFQIHVVYPGGNEFDIMLSAHNQVVQTLYEGGLLAIIAVAHCALGMDRGQAVDRNGQTQGMIRVAVMAMLLMMLAEAPGWDAVLILMHMGALLRQSAARKEQREDGMRHYFRYCSGIRGRSVSGSVRSEYSKADISEAGDHFGG